MAFKLGAEGQLPQIDIVPPQPLNLAGISSAGDANVGGVLYGAYCSVCHGPMAMSAGPLPDLRYSPMLLTDAAFHSIVLDGSLLSQGMPGFSADIGAAEVESIRAYLLQLAGQVQ
jgi:mono/diheme cytochrome c family protein